MMSILFFYIIKKVISSDQGITYKGYGIDVPSDLELNSGIDETDIFSAFDEIDESLFRDTNSYIEEQEVTDALSFSDQNLSNSDLNEDSTIDKNPQPLTELSELLFDSSTEEETLSSSHNSTSSETDQSSSVTKTPTQAVEDNEDKYDGIIMIVIILLFLAVVLAGVYVVYHRKNHDDQEIEYTRAILGDEAFEFSQLETI